MTGPFLSQILGPSRPSDAELPPPTTSLHLHQLPQHHERRQGTSDQLTSQQPIGLTLATSASISPAASASTSSASTRQNHGGNNLYACRDCGRSYSRPEHLVRHVRIHTLGRRFSCGICQKSFARKDLLSRHVANHENNSSSKRRRKNTIPGAGRVSQACRPCAAARVKCDDSKPCRRCVKRKLSCMYSEAELPSGNPHGHVPVNGHAPFQDVVGVCSVDGYAAASTNSSSPASHGQAYSVLSASASVSDATATMKSTPQSQASSYQSEENQFPTPETSQDQ
ncbi:hypothetical protein E4U55_008118, partial [Claviceps digitariae]